MKLTKKEKRIMWAQIEERLSCAYDLIEQMKDDNTNLSNRYKMYLDIALKSIQVPMDKAFDRAGHEIK